MGNQQSLVINKQSYGYINTSNKQNSSVFTFQFVNECKCPFCQSNYPLDSQIFNDLDTGKIHVYLSNCPCCHQEISTLKNWLSS